MIRRRGDWVHRLGRAIAIGNDIAFAWGRFDCCLAAAGLVAEMTGTDVAAGLRRYRSAAGAANVLRKEAPDVPADQRLAAVAARIAAAHGMPALPSARYAQRGDVVYFVGMSSSAAPAPALGVVDLNGLVFVAPGVVRGWARFPLAAAAQAWRVPA